MNKDQNLASEYIIFITVIILVVLGLVYIFTVTDKTENKPASVITEKIDVFADVALQAQAAVVIDLSSGKVLFAKNADAQLPLASLTKIMTALVARENLPTQTLVKITPEAISAEGDSGLKVKESWRAKDLSDFTLQVSSNDGARALALAVVSLSNDRPKASDFVRIMNERARNIGLNQTYFLNETGLDRSVGGEVSGGYGSARDLATLIGTAVKEYPDMFESTTKPEVEINSFEFKHKAVATNKVAGELPFLVASKTGFTDLAGGNLAIVTNIGLMYPVSIVVLGSTEDGRFSDVKLLSEKLIQSAGAEF